MNRPLTRLALLRERIRCALDRRESKKTALFEFDVADVLTREFQERADAFLDDGAIKDLIADMVDPSNVTLDDNGRVVFTSDVLDRYDARASKHLGTDYARAVRPHVAARTLGEYRGGGKASSAAAGFNPAFGMRDDRSLKQLHRDGMYWIKTGNDRNVAPDIPKVVEGVLAEGLGRDDAAKLLAQRLGERYAVESSRWKVVAGAAMNRSRTHAKVRQLIRWTVTKYEWLSMLDERTSQVCRELHGKVWETKPAAEVIDRFEEAASPEAAVDAMPWVSVDKDGNWFANTSEGKKPTSPDDLGAPMPPIHGRCRSTIIPHEESGYEERTKIVRGGKVRAEEKPANPVKDDRKVGTLLRDLGMKPPPGVDKYTVGELANVAQPGTYTAGFVDVAQTWAVTDDGVLLSTGWVDKESAQQVLGWSLYAEEAVMSLSLEGQAKVPTAAWEGIGAKVKALAETHGIAAAVHVPKGATTMAVAFRGWQFAPSTAEAFGAWLEAEGVAAKLAKRGGRVANLTAASPFKDWLRVNVGGANPLMAFLNGASNVRLMPGV